MKEWYRDFWYSPAPTRADLLSTSPPERYISVYILLTCLHYSLSTSLSGMYVCFGLILRLSCPGMGHFFLLVESCHSHSWALCARCAPYKYVDTQLRSYVSVSIATHWKAWVQIDISSSNLILIKTSQEVNLWFTMSVVLKILGVMKHIWDSDEKLESFLPEKFIYVLLLKIET